LTECGQREAKDEERATLSRAVARYVQRAAGESVPADAWEGIEVPAHLLMNFRVIDEAGRELAMGRDLAALKAQLESGGKDR